MFEEGGEATEDAFRIKAFSDFAEAFHAHASLLRTGIPKIGHDLLRQPLGRLRERRRAHNLVELCVEPGSNRIGEVRQRLITVLVDEPS